MCAMRLAGAGWVASHSGSLPPLSVSILSSICMTWIISRESYVARLEYRMPSWSAWLSSSRENLRNKTWSA